MSTGLKSLDRLRDRIELTVKELERLRNENAELQKQLDEARALGIEWADGTPVVFSDSPSTLRTRVESFIDTLDRYIEDANSTSAGLDSEA